MIVKLRPSTHYENKDNGRVSQHGTRAKLENHIQLTLPTESPEDQANITEPSTGPDSIYSGKGSYVPFIFPGVHINIILSGQAHFSCDDFCCLSSHLTINLSLIAQH